jgi:HEAT repeat protein
VDVKPIQPRTIQLVTRLALDPGMPARWIRLVGLGRWTVLDDIIAAGEPEAALALLPHALAAAAPRRALLLDAIDGIVRASPPEALAWLEQRARLVSPWRREAWAHSPEVSPERVRGLSSAPTLGVASLHASGWVREAAAERLSACLDELAVPFLLLRCNDWVAEVRAAARAGVEAHLARAGAGPFVPWLPLVDRLGHGRRNDLSTLVAAITGVLTGPAGSAALQAGCRHASRAVRRCCIALALEARVLDLVPIVRRGLADRDTLIKAMVAGRAAAVLPWEALEPMLPGMLRGGTPPVRAAAIDALGSRQGAATRAMLEPLLLDRHRHVRAAARRHLQGIPGLDLRALYRDALAGASGPMLLGALGGLAEVGAPGDAALAVPFLGHQRASVRAAAVLVLGALDPVAHREALVAALSDPSARVSWKALSFLVQGPPLDGDRLFALARQASHAHTWLAALALARTHDYWVAGPLLLRVASTAAGTDRRSSAGQALLYWEERFTRTFTRPTPAQVAELELLLNRAAGLDPAVRDRLRAILPSIRRRLGG